TDVGTNPALRHRGRRGLRNERRGPGDDGEDGEEEQARGEQLLHGSPPWVRTIVRSYAASWAEATGTYDVGAVGPCVAAPPTGPYVPDIVRRDVEEIEEAKPAPTELELDRMASVADRGIESYVERCRMRIPSFVSANFSLAQTWELQRPTLWLDLACAPVNSAW